MAFTSNLPNGGSDQVHGIEMRAKGQTKAKNLINLPKNDYEALKGDMWELGLNEFFGFTDCITVKDIEGIDIIAASNDGWNIESIVTFMVVNQYYWELSSADLNVNQWVDGNGEPPHLRFPLTLVI